MSFFDEDDNTRFSWEALKELGVGVLSSAVQYVDKNTPTGLGVEQQVFDDQGIVPVQQNAPSADNKVGNIGILEEIKQRASELNKAIIQYQDTDPYANFSYSSYTIPDETTEQQEARERKEQAESNFIKAALKPFENAAEKINDLGYRFSPNSTATNDIDELMQEDIDNGYYIDKDEFGVSRRYHDLYGIHPDDEPGYLELHSTFSNFKKEISDAVDTARSILSNPVLENPNVTLGNTAISAVMILQNSLDPFGVKGSSKADKVVGNFNPINKGSLPEAVANTFRSATYSQKVLEEDIILYRAYGGKARELGQYWTRTKPEGPLQTVIDSALDQNWGNTATQVAQIRVPKGTAIYEGFAASQGGLIGGGNQVYIYLERIDPSWLIK